MGRDLPRRSEWLVPTIVRLEPAKRILREADEAHLEQVIAFAEVCLVVRLDTKLALPGAEHGRRHRLAAADVVYATAQAHEAPLLTGDSHVADLPGVELIGKKKA